MTGEEPGIRATLDLFACIDSDVIIPSQAAFVHPTSSADVYYHPSREYEYSATLVNMDSIKAIVYVKSIHQQAEQYR